MKRLLVLFIAMLLLGSAGFAQQTGSISGKVTLQDGQPAAGVRVEATSDVLPRPRTATTSANGEYKLPQLPPGGPCKDS